MVSSRTGFSLIAALCSVSLLGCGPSLSLVGSDLDRYARDVDGICIESYQRGIEGEEEAEATGEAKGWSGPKIEAEIRYGWAEALVGQYQAIAALGPAPEKAGLMDRWARTSLERARLYRLIGDAWMKSDSHREIGYGIDLNVAKIMADHLAEPLPLKVCGEPTSGESAERIPTGQLLGYAPLQYTAEFPLASLPALRRVKRVYWHNRVAAKLARRVPGSETVLIEIRLKPKLTQSVIGSELRLFRSRRDSAEAWLGLVPARQ